MNKLIFILVPLFFIISCSKDKNKDITTNCDPVSYLDTVEITTNSATLQWQYIMDNPNISFVVEYGLEGFAIGTGTILNTKILESAIALTNLSAATNYSFYVKTKCDNSNFSENVGPKNFTTLICEPVGVTNATNISETSAEIYWYNHTNSVEIE